MKKLNEMEYVSDVGVGGFGIVNKYKDPRTQSLFAVKQLQGVHLFNPKFVKRFQKEIKILEGLQECEYIIRLEGYSSSLDGDGMYLIMPFLDDNLPNLIGNNYQNITIEQQYKIFEQIIFAIKFAHNKNILHRDLAPFNILLVKKNNEYEVKVIDFGLGKNLSTGSNHTVTSDKNLGHYRYTAPEQLQNLKNASIRSDIYSLGCLCHYIFTGEHPDNPQQFDFSTLFTKATSRDRDDRYATVQELEEHYLILKKISQARNGTNQHVSLKKLLISGNNIDINELHERLIEKRAYSDITLDFLYPVTQYFLKKNHLAEYYKLVGNNFHSFMEKYYSLFHAPKPSWDFRNMDDYGQLLVKVIHLVNIPQSKLFCFKVLIEMAYYGNRYSVQNKLKSVFTKELIPQAIEVELAEFIESSSFDMEEKHFNLDEIPSCIKNVILECIDKNTKKKESQKQRELEDFDF